MYIYILTGLISFSAGFCFKILCFPNNIQIDIRESDEIDNLQDYIIYLEEMLNDSTTLTTEAVALNNVDVSCNNITSTPVSYAEFNNSINLNDNLPSAPPLPNATLVSNV